MNADDTPEETLGDKLLSFIGQCSAEEQSVFFAMVERAALEPEVSGFETQSTAHVASNNRMREMTSKIMANSHEMKKALIGNLPR